MTIERRIAGKARDLVSMQIEKTPKHEAETDYRSVCEGLPILLRNAGLLQTVAFLKAKHDKQETIYQHLETQLRNLGFLNTSESLIGKVTGPDLTMPQYRFLSEIVMLVAYWQKRMAQALLRPAEKEQVRR